VHRATTRGGDRVAVKVQYPGIDKAIENDLKSLSLLEAMMGPVGRRYHTKETLDEVRTVFLAELDYRHEAETSDAFRAIHEDDPEIVIPKVHHSLSTRRVLTCDLLGGVDYQTFCEKAPQADRDAAGRTIWRFMFRPLYAYGLLYADPHPGNYRFLGGGRVAFLDFGCTKKLPERLVMGLKEYVIAQQAGDEAAFERACIDVFGYDKSDPAAWKLYTDYARLLSVPAHEGGGARGDRVLGPRRQRPRVQAGRDDAELADAGEHAERLHVRESFAVGALERHGGARVGRELA
jgi:predicted unusual protein kinase regulating ubiquinone biosynthesis (AarF/ABC1/UbiB family)